MTSPDLITAAREAARRGWRVIPLHRVGPDGLTCSCEKGRGCNSKGKHPKNKRWQTAQPLSAADVEATWDVERPPNLGLATGAESGFWVLDIDPKNDGFESMKALVAEHGPLPTTYVAGTGSGGYHYYFALPDFELRNSADRVGKGIDTRADGGQVVAAPSRTDKGDYVVIVDAPIAAAPDWLLEVARKDDVDIAAVTAEDLPKPDDLDEAAWRRLSAYAQRAIDSELGRLDALAAAKTPNPDDYRGEPWNHTTFEVSCSLLEFANSPWCAYSPGQAARDVLERSPRDVGFDSAEVTKTFRSATERVGAKARPLPEDRRRESAEEDPLFGGPDVRRPTEGGGAQPNPVASPTRRTYFGGEQGTTPLYREMSNGVFDTGPVGWGQDNDFWSYADGVWAPDHYVVQHRIVDMLGNAYRKAHTTNTGDVVQRFAQPITGDPLEAKMNFRNGMLDWRTGAIEAHDPDLGSTVQFGCDWIPDAKCPKFDAFLADVMHADYVDLAWEMIGYLMLSGNPLQVAFLFYGSGGNGKGTLLRVLERLLGQANIATESLDNLNGNRFRSANLFGKIANIAGDIDATYQEHTAMFKSITGEDMITGERKNRDPFRFQSWAVPVFSANKFPGSADVTPGYLRRWIVLHFHKRIRDVIPGFSDLLEAELAGIAARGVAALGDLMARERFDPHGEATGGKDAFALAIDQVRQWLASGGPSGAPEVQTPAATLYQNYKAWSDTSGAKYPLRESDFVTRLESIGFASERIAGDVLISGLSVPPSYSVTKPSEFFG